MTWVDSYSFSSQLLKLIWLCCIYRFL